MKTIQERTADAARLATDTARDARLLKALATDAVEDSVHATRRTLRRARARALDTRDDLAYRVRREPLAALTMAFGAGALLGVAFASAWWRGGESTRTGAH